MLNLLQLEEFFQLEEEEETKQKKAFETLLPPNPDRFYGSWETLMYVAYVQNWAATNSVTSSLAV